MDKVPWWASETSWRKWAVWVTALMAVVLVALTFDSLARIKPGAGRVPSYAESGELPVL